MTADGHTPSCEDGIGRVLSFIIWVVTKTTVCLPDDVKRDLERLAAASGRSEAPLIRDAVAALIGAATQPRPRASLFAGGDSTLSDRVNVALRGFGER